MNDDSRQLLTEEQAAHVLQISPFTLLRLRVHGLRGRTGPAWVKLGKSIRYRRSDLDAWIASQVVQPTPPSPQIGRPRKTERVSTAA
ncbi:helix-turn-helix transcriptional regulator [Gluconacetobacter diazotrophicus]|uniref:helix-turn-helix transcriptional regulator n=1 Tax=Gluconacetobacter diazotrophicus TaxID=33996 RepID=UPI0011991ACE|nr:helix-turn-helix domain-containing protein [Gluconacetobacter diazotrophicus]TWB05625.1 helix-turn-helix protein [Gluconacetobacter diazotrophicus]